WTRRGRCLSLRTRRYTRNVSPSASVVGEAASLPGGHPMRRETSNLGRTESSHGSRQKGLTLGSSRVTACPLAGPPWRSFVSGASAASSPPLALRRLPAGATPLPGGDCTH